MYKLLVFASLFVVSFAASKYNKCPFSIGKYPFDEQKFAGSWYVIAATTTNSNKPLRCSKFQVELGKDSQTYKYSGFSNSTEVTKEIFTQSVFGSEKSSSFSLAVVRKDGRYVGPFKHIVVATDYDNFALTVSCRTVFDENAKTFNRELYAGVLSRGKSLSGETFKVLSNVLSGYDIPEGELYEVDHNGCS